MRRKSITITAVLVLCAAIIGGATFAYMNGYDTKTNNLTYVGSGEGEAAGIDLAEPAWDPDPDNGYQFDDPTHPNNYPLGKNESDKPKYGVNKGNNFVPGTVIPKNPQVQFTGTLDSVYVGMIVKGETGGLTMAQMDKIYDIDFQLSIQGWKEVTPANSKNGDRYFVYQKALAKGETTPPLFNKIVIKSQETSGANKNDDIYTLITKRDGYTPLKHNLVVNAYSVQAENESVTSAGGTWDALKALQAEFSTTGPNSTTDWDMPTNP